MTSNAKNFHQLSVNSIVDGITEGLDTKLAKQMRIFATNINKPLPSSSLAAMHRRLGTEVRGAIQSAYNETYFDKDRPYRSEDSGKDRRYSGAIEAAIQQEGLIVSSKGSSFSFIDIDQMRQFAPHWRRLNFGAKGSKGAATENFAVGSMRFDNLGLDRRSSPVKFGFRNTQPSTGFSIPRGWWSEDRVSSSSVPKGPYSGANDAFYLAPKKSRALVTQGIRGERFIDRGVRHLNNRYPKELVKLVKNTVTEGAKKSGFK